MKTSELTGVALDWAVAKCEGATDFWFDTVATHWVKLDGKDRALRYGWAQSYLPSTDWAQGGPIIERERLWVGYSAVKQSQSLRLAVMEDAVVQCHKTVYPPQPKSTTGPTILIAAMRCYVVSKLGNDIELPKELAGGNIHEIP